jgi:hypothetical protein
LTVFLAAEEEEEEAVGEGIVGVRFLEFAVFVVSLLFQADAYASSDDIGCANKD